MRKGKIRIITGCILIVLQILGIIGNAKTGLSFNLSFDNIGIFLYDLIFLIGYFLIGIIGVILLITGLIAYNKKPKTTLSEEHEQVAIEQNPTKTILKTKSSKQRFCKLCGGEIHPATKKCSKCGKQYFKGVKLNINTIIIVILSISLIASITINVVQNNEISYLYDDYFETQNYIRQLEDENSKHLKWINLYETKVVAVLDGSKIYHKGSCEKIKGETINLGWKSGLDSQGYTACPYCHK